MAYCSIGKTTSGRNILIITNNWNNEAFLVAFTDFSSRDFFDAYLAIQTLIVREKRRSFVDQVWLEALNASEIWLNNNIDKKIINDLKAILSIDSAFAARDYGNKLLHQHFQIRF